MTTLSDVAVAAPIEATSPQPRRRLRPRVLGELLVVLCLLRVYDLARGAAAVRETAALQHGWSILRFEAWAHLDVELAADRWTAAHRVISLAASDFYQFLHVPVTLLVLVVCWWRRPDLYRTARNQLVAINLVALTVFLLLPVAPPRLLPGGGFVDAVADAGFGVSHGGPVHADQFGAMPSLHLGWAVWVAVVAGRMLSDRRLRAALWAYPVMVTGVVVITGNHYLLDAVAGTLVTLSVVAFPQLVMSFVVMRAQARLRNTAA